AAAPGHRAACFLDDLPGCPAAPPDGLPQGLWVCDDLDEVFLTAADEGGGRTAERLAFLPGHVPLSAGEQPRSAARPPRPYYSRHRPRIDEPPAAAECGDARLVIALRKRGTIAGYRSLPTFGSRAPTAPPA